MPTPRHAKRIPRLALVALRIVFAAVALAGLRADSFAQRVMLATRTLSQAADAIDAGAVPSSTPVEITVNLAASPGRTAALGEFLAGVTQASSPNYHQWLTPQQFADRFGATGDQIAAVTAWVTSQGLTVGAVSAGKTRLAVSGTMGAAEVAFAISPRQYRIGDRIAYASATAASLPAEVAPMIVSIDGLDDPPSTVADAGLSALADAIDANTTSVVTINSAACSSADAQADYDACRALFRQANAQGITLLTTNGCLAEVTAVIAPGSPAAPQIVGIEPRPAWQNVPGLPAGSTRVAPDLAATSIAAFAQTISTIVQQSGTRQGNINATLYALAAEPGLYTQPDAAPPGTWEPATGLGQVDLAKLAKAWPRGVTASATAVSSSLYGVTYGEPFTLAASVQSLNGGNSASVPTGTVTFAAAAQGSLGTATLTNGNATLALPGTLPVGTYVISANYSGDGMYAASSSPPSAVVTISQATGVIATSISPSTVGIGGTATLTVSVTLPYPGAPPAGNVTATVNGVPGAVYTAALAVVPNTASAATTISIPAPVNPGTYTVQTTCAGSANFQCPTPGLVSLTSTGTGGGPTSNTTTALTISPLSPTAGQPATLTATIVSAVAGTPTGTMTFYDNGNLIASAPVSNKQASAVATLQAGTAQVLTASYSGNATFNPSTSPGLLVNVAGVASSMTLASSATSALRSADIVFTAQVTASIAPTGVVTFFDTYNGSTAQIGTATLTSASAAISVAQISTPALLDGTHQVFAAYLGDANSGAATSPNLAIAITDYTVTPTPQALTLTRGQTGKVTLAVAAVGSFAGKVNFTCIPPANTQTTCSISSAALTGAGSVTLTIATTAAQARTTPQGPNIFARTASGAALAMLFCFCAPRRRRRLPVLLLALVSLALAAGLGLGCSSSTIATPVAPTGTPAGTMMFSIETAGSDGVTTVAHDFLYQVTLQ
jgi:trimeric autotransporter adhesin